MQNHGAAVILMHDLLKDIEIIFPENFDLDSVVQMKPDEPFSENAILFLNALSVLLRNDPRSNDFPEIVTFAFFCRKANTVQLKRSYYLKDNLRNGRGI